MKSSVKGLDSLLKKLNAMGDEVTSEIDAIAEGTASEIALNARLKAPKNFGRLQQSINYSKADELKYVVTVDADYGAYVEFGTGRKVQVPPEFSDMASKFKGKSGSFEEGLKAIGDWAKAKGIPESAVYPIFMSIIKNGIRPQPYLYPAFVKGRAQFIEDLKQLLKRLTK